MEKNLNALIAKLEKRWFAKGEQKQYNAEMRVLLENDEYIDVDDVDDIMWFFENVFIGDDFDSIAIINDFKENCNDENVKYINFMSNFSSIMSHMNGLAIDGEYY